MSFRQLVFRFPEMRRPRLSSSSDLILVRWRCGMTPHLSSTGASRRRAHSDRLPGLLFASDAEAAPVAARPGVDTDGGAGKVGRHQNDRCLDSDRRSTLVDSAALYTAFSRHQATHREAEIAFAQPTATAPCYAKRELRNRSTDRPVGGPLW